MDISKYRIDKRILVIFVLFIVFFPHGSSYYFDGLPIKTESENIYILFILPFSIIFFSKDLNFLVFKIFLFIIFLIKIVLIFSPVTGINVNQYFNNNDVNKNQYIKSYDTFWNHNITTLQTNEWKNKKNFPIDWKEFGGKKFFEKKYKEKLYNNEDFDNINLIYTLNFILKSTQDEIFKIKADGCVKSNFVIKNAVDEIKKNFSCNEDIVLNEGLNYIEGYISYEGKNWSLLPLLKKTSDSQYVSALKKGKIYKENHFILKHKFQHLIIYLSYTFILLIYLIPIILLFFKLIKDREFKKYFIASILFFLFFLITKYILFNFFNYGIVDGHGGSIISISIIFFIILTLILNKNLNFIKIENLNFKYLIFLIFAPVILFFYISNNIYLINQVPTIGWGDDWNYFEFFSRSMVVDNSWLLAGEEIVKFRLGIRYIYAISHVIFGMSQFALKLFEPWIIVISIYFLLKISQKIGLSKYYTLIFSIIILTLYMGGNYRWLIGRGLSEFYSLFIIVLSIYIFLKLKLNYKNLFLLSLLPIVGTWFREDHLFLYGSLIFLKFKMDKENSFFQMLFNFIQKNYKYILFYWSVLIVGFFILFLRNYYLSGDFGIFHNLNIMNEKLSYYNNFSRMLLGNDPQTTSIPNFTSIFLFSAFLISFFSLIKNNIKFLNFQIFFPIIVFSILFPYLFAVNWAYHPRFTIHYLPFSILIFLLFVQNFVKNLSNMINK